MPMLIQAEVDKIKPCPRNKNFHSEEKIQQMMLSIKANKNRVLDPIAVHPVGGELLEIIDGECRWRAVCRLGIETVDALLHEVYDPMQVDEMRFIANNTRSFDFISQCQELANLHRQGLSVRTLAYKFGGDYSWTANKVAVGYFPEEFVHEIRQAMQGWSIKSLAELLRLRLIKDGERVRLITPSDTTTPEYYKSLVYTEVVKTFRKVERGELNLGADLRAYVAERRLQLEEGQRQELLEAELQRQAAQSQVKQQREMERLKREVVQEARRELEAALTEARKLREEKARLVAETPRKLKDLRQALSRAHQKELAQRDASFSKRLAELQRQLADLRKERDQALQRARQEMRRELEAELRQLKALADREKTEAEKRQALIDELQASFDEKLKAEEEKIQSQFRSQLAEKEQALEDLSAERERFQAELQSLQKEVDSYSAEIAKLEEEQRRAIAAKEKEIAEKDQRIEELLAQREEVRREASQEALELAEEEAQRRAEEYREQLEAEYEEYKRTLEEHFAQREEELRIKTEKTVDDAINHFMKVCGEMDASIRNLIYSLLDHMRDDQVRDVLVRVEWLYRKLIEVGGVLKEKMDKMDDQEAADYSSNKAIELPKLKEEKEE